MAGSYAIPRVPAAKQTCQSTGGVDLKGAQPLVPNVAENSQSFQARMETIVPNGLELIEEWWKGVPFLQNRVALDPGCEDARKVFHTLCLVF